MVHVTLALATPLIVGQLIGLPVIVAAGGKLTELIMTVVRAEPGIVDMEDAAGAADSEAGEVSTARGTPAAEQVAEA